jgi:hypothetical protein
MCVVVELAEARRTTWSRQDVAIQVPGDLSRTQMLVVARGMLQELGVDQPSESTMEARCFCGEPLTIWDMPERWPAVPRQRVHGVTEVHRGA